MRAMAVVTISGFLLFLAISACGQHPSNTADANNKTPPQVSGVPPTGVYTIQTDLGALSENVHDFIYRQVELETKRLDRLIQNAETVGKIMVSLVIAIATILSVFGYRSIKELKNEIQSSVEGLVEKTLKDKSNSGEMFDQLVTKLESAQKRWAQIEKSIENLDHFAALSSSQSGDAQGVYRTAKDLSNKTDITVDERRAALGYLLKIIELGEQGRVDPNLLFNACSLASEMDFDHEALKLASLCAHWDPKPSHVLRKSRLEDTFGMRFELNKCALMQSQMSQTEVRQEAWMVARELASKSPTYQCELIFSELHNIASRNRESGYIDEAIAVMEDITKDEMAPSYAYAVLSGFYAMRGNATWLRDYLETNKRAAKILSRESPACSWYEATIRDILEMAVHATRTEEIKQILNEAGISIS